jgi:uncharacterized membrane protein
MSMLSSVVAYGATAAALVMVDLIWLAVMSPRFYRPTLGDVALPDVNLPPAVAFYALYPVGLVLFAVTPALKSGSLPTAIVHGALFGFFTFATYDLTNHATLRNWTLGLTLVDIAWGTCLGAATAVVGYLAVTKLLAA